MTEALSVVDAKLVSGEPYQMLVSECSGIIVETQLSSRAETVKGKWLLGQAVVTHIEYIGSEKGGRGIESFATRLAKDLTADGRSVSARELRRCVQFYTAFPTLGLSPEQDAVETLERLAEIPGGKDLSWKKISREMLPAPGLKKMTKAEIVLEYSARAVGREWTEDDHEWLTKKMGGKRGTEAQAQTEG